MLPQWATATTRQQRCGGTKCRPCFTPRDHWTPLSLQLPRTPLAAALVSSSTATAEISRAEVSVARNIGPHPQRHSKATNAFHREKRSSELRFQQKSLRKKHREDDDTNREITLEWLEIWDNMKSWEWVVHPCPPPFLSIHKISKLLAWWLWSSSHLKMSVREKASPTKDRWYSISSKKGSNLGEACKHDQCPSSDGKL